MIFQAFINFSLLDEFYSIHAAQTYIPFPYEFNYFLDFSVINEAIYADLQLFLTL
jgi:hypothetical protein